MNYSAFAWDCQDTLAWALPRFAIVIPARFASTRFPGKPLALLAGAGGLRRSLIERSWRAACAVAGEQGVWVATEDERVADAVRGFGGQVVMTAPGCRNGTERCADAVRALGLGHEIIVNFQGDAPLTPAPVVRALVAALARDEAAGMATAALRCCPDTYAHLASDAARGRVGGTTVVVNRLGHALYFSKRIIPFVPADVADAHRHIRLHLGLYAYRAGALAAYAAAPPSPLEALEGLEQMRCLEGHAPVRVVTFDGLGPMVELNNPEDIAPIEAILAQRGMA
jgi:3-deoxy-manno-octulosonate cytidylyltransferase (CMP-KDO synthetase)